MRRGLAGLVVAGTLLATGAAPVAAQEPELRVTLDVNVVFVGFERLAFYGHEEEPHDFRAIYADALEQEFLPRTNVPVIRNLSLDGPPVGAHQRLTYRPRVLFADRRFEDALFAELRRLGRDGPATRSQQAYNAQAGNQLDVTPSVLRIPGPQVERWLARNVPQVRGAVPGADTIVFLNWFGRPDFRFHVYQGEGVDPDTGRDDALNDTAGSAWGGSRERLWFHDLSAGPDWFNWNVDDVEFDPPYDGFLDARVPPIWEMDGDEPPWLLSDATTALGVYARSALQGLFGHSPLYDPLASVPAPGRERLVRLNLFREDPSDPASYLRQDYLENGLRSLQPEIAVRSTLTQHPFAGDDALTFRIYTRAFDPLPVEPGCWQELGSPVTQLFCHVAGNVDRLAAPGEPGDHVMPNLLYAVENATFRAEGEHAPLGVADSDPFGNPFASFAQHAPGLRARFRDVSPGVGMSTLLLHENGHHVGQSHPHDGWDSEVGLRWGPFIAKFLYTLGECACTMGYVSSSSFGRFERDNQDRNLSARYWATARRALGDLGPRERARTAADLQIAADAFARADFRSAVVAAGRAYERALADAGDVALRRAADLGGDRRGGPPPEAIDRPQPYGSQPPAGSDGPIGVPLPRRGGYVRRFGG